MVLEHRADCSSQWATIESNTPKIGCTTQTLLKWIKRAAIDEGTRDRVTTTKRERVTVPERDVKEWRRLCSSGDAWQWLVREIVGSIVGAAKH